MSPRWWSFIFRFLLRCCFPHAVLGCVGGHQERLPGCHVEAKWAGVCCPPSADLARMLVMFLCIDLISVRQPHDLPNMFFLFFRSKGFLAMVLVLQWSCSPSHSNTGSHLHPLPRGDGTTLNKHSIIINKVWLCLVVHPPTFFCSVVWLVLHRGESSYAARSVSMMGLTSGRRGSSCARCCSHFFQHSSWSQNRFSSSLLVLCRGCYIVKVTTIPAQGLVKYLTLFVTIFTMILSAVTTLVSLIFYYLKIV